MTTESSDDRPAGEALLICDGSAAKLTAASTLTQPDGAHITVRNTSGTQVTMNLGRAGNPVPPGESTFVLDVAPSVQIASCSYDSNRNIATAGPVEILDADGNWRATNIDCTRLPLTSWEEPLGSGASPDEAVRWWANNRPEALTEPIRQGDEIVLVGYPESPAPRYVSRKGGIDTNIFRLEQIAEGWRATPHENCPR